MLLLLDGLDEVREEDNKRVLQQIRDFSTKSHASQFVITCRIAAQEYKFKNFTEVEVADFDSKQIAIFSENWFRRSDPNKAARFLQELAENEPIFELAKTPLLLTLLCLIFQERGDLLRKRSELYQEGIKLLLEKWDAEEGIERSDIYKNLSTKKKQALLSQIALTTFEQQDYFFKPEFVEELIETFFCELPGSDLSKEDLEVDSETVLRKIEAQHGLLIERAKNIYSFSHLTFQEYFAAREIVANSAYENLVKHLTEKRWREVFLMTASMTRDADDLLRPMKQIIDKMLADEKLQQFLRWVDQRSDSVEVAYRPVAVRAFYFSLSRSRIFFTPSPVLFLDRALALALDSALTFVFTSAHDYSHTHDNILAHDNALARALAFAFDLPRALPRILPRARGSDSNSVLVLLNPNLDCILDRVLALNLNHIDPQLKCQLQAIRDQLPDTSWENQSTFIQWWQGNGQAWAEQLRAVIIEHRNIGHDWQFSDEQKQCLQQYYDANKLLVDCLNSGCYVSRDVRQEIEDTLLLPMSETVRDRISPT